MALRLEYGYHLWNNIDIDCNNYILVYSSVITLRSYCDIFVLPHENTL